MKKQKSALSLLLAIIMVVSMGTGCGSSETEMQPISNSSKPVELTDSESRELTSEEIEAQNKFANSTPENDTDIGLKNVKIDTADYNLTDEQKAVLAYFDNDYLSVNEYVGGYEHIRRYPQVFDGAQLQLDGIVKKVISQTSDTFEAILWVGVDSLMYSDILNGYTSMYSNIMSNFVLIRGASGSALFMEGDWIDTYGRYVGIETVEVDGTSHTIPVLEANTTLIHDGSAWQVRKFDISYIKKVAKAVFGDDIEIREPIVDEDYVDGADNAIFYDPFYVVELENQSNAKFTKYRFYQCRGLIEDAKEVFGAETSIQRTLEFSADFEHFFLFTYDSSLECLTLEYYDHDLNKIWKREFEETTSAAYDYTKNNIYIVANNEFYIINIETGEDTFAPAYIGSRLEIRKLSDGIVCISENKSDAVMKMDINGNMIWKTNLSSNVYEVCGIQIIEDRMVLQLSMEDGMHYVAVDSATGAVLQDAVALS